MAAEEKSSQADIILLDFRKAEGNPILQAVAIRDAIKMMLDDGIGKEKAKLEIEHQINKKRGFILQRLNLLKVHPDIQALLKDERLNISQVKFMTSNELLNPDIQRFIARELSELAKSSLRILDSKKVFHVIAEATKMARQMKREADELEPVIILPTPPKPKKKPGPKVKSRESKPQPPEKRYLDRETRESLNTFFTNVTRSSKCIIKIASLLIGFLDSYTDISDKDSFIAKLDEAIDSIRCFFVAIGHVEELQKPARMPKKRVNVNMKISNLMSQSEILADLLDSFTDDIGEDDELKIKFLKNKPKLISGLQEVIGVIGDLKEKLDQE